MIAARTVALLAGAVLLGDLVAVATADRPTPTDPASRQATDAPGVEQSSEPGSAGESLDEQLTRVLGHVEQIRGLTFPAPPDVRYATRAELRAEVEQEIEAYTPQDAELDERLLIALGQIPPGTDLRSLLVTAYGEQVAGFYDPETAELVVGTEDPDVRVGRLDEITLAHELGHALVDARIGLPDLEAFEEGQEDALLAAQALVEGDATALMNDFTIRAMSPIDQMLLAEEALALLDTLESFTELPWILQRSLEFPYVEGLAFVESVLGPERDWAALDRAYAAPPTTTLEVLVPELYGRVEARPPADFGRLDPQSWTRDRTLGFGALDLRLLLEAPGGDPGRALSTVDEVTRSWRGGTMRQWSAGEDVTLAIHVTHDPAVDVCGALVDWHGAAFPAAAVVSRPGDARWQADGPTQDTVLACDDGQARLALAPDLPTANRAIGG